MSSSWFPNRKVPIQLAGLELVIVLLLIVLNGVFAMSELAIVSSRTSRLQSRAEEGSGGAKAALKLAEDPSRFLSTVQIGITLIGIVTGAFGGATLSGPLASVLDNIPGVDRYASQISVLVVIAIITYLSLIIGELVPKRLALQNPESIAVLMAPAMTLLSKITAPVVAFLAISGDFVIRVLGVKASSEPEVTEEEIQLMLRQGADAGVFEEYEHRMVTGIFDIGDRTASELMTPRHRIEFLDLAAGEDHNLNIMRESPHSFYPVCDGSTDNVVGIISTRELWRRSISGEPTGIRESLTPALFVPEIAPIVKVIDMMRHQSAPMAVVVDEYGGIEGLLTFNDVLSDLVGEIDDPDRTNIRGGVRREDGSWLFDGIFPVHELREVLHIESLPGEEEGRYETIGGFVMDQLGNIPDAADSFTFETFRFEVVDMDGIRIDKVMITPLTAGAGDAPQTGDD
jgi:putative hemolysin